MMFISILRNYLNAVIEITFPIYLIAFWIKGARFDVLKVWFQRAEIILRILARKQRGGGKR